MFAKILVPLDGSALAECALTPALTLAQAARGHVILLRAPEASLVYLPETEGHNLPVPEQAWDHPTADCQEYLGNFRYRYGRSFPDLKIETRINHGDAAAVIVDTAVDEDVDLIVMSTHGYSGFSRWLLGSVTERVLRHAPCPVLVVRGQRPVANVLITLDGSALSESALEPGMAVARAYGAKVTLLRVETAMELVDVREVAAIDKVEPGLGEQLLQSFFNQTETYLEDVARRYRHAGVLLQIAEAQGLAAQQILHFAESQQIDLIVMATHGRSGLSRWVYGSVTEKVLRHTDSALLIVRPPAHMLKE